MDKTVFNAGDEIPDNLDYAFIIARDGFYLKKRTPLYEATVKVNEIPCFKEQKAHVELVAPKIPYALLQKARHFFQATYMKFKSEAMVFLLFENNIWDVFAPKQEVSSTNVEYENTLHKEGKRPAGTIHSHCNMAASFSTTDDSDDECFDGVHITLGKIFEEIPNIAASIAVNGHRFEIKPEEIITGLPENSNDDHPWLATISEKSTLSRGHSLFARGDSFSDRIKSTAESFDIVGKLEIFNWLKNLINKEIENDPMAAMYVMEEEEKGGEPWEW